MNWPMFKWSLDTLLLISTKTTDLLKKNSGPVWNSESNSKSNIIQAKLVKNLLLFGRTNTNFLKNYLKKFKTPSWLKAN